MKKKKKIILLIIFSVIGIALISVSIFLTIPKELSSPVKELLGEERTEISNEIISIVEEYVSDKNLIKDYLDSKEQKRITVKEIKEDLKIDVSKFEKKEYGCSDEYTTIDFNDDYSDHVISITCSILFKK